MTPTTKQSNGPDAGSPVLSVVLVTPASYAEIRTTLRHLSAQTIADRIEVLVISPDPSKVDVPDAVAASFQAVRHHGVGPIESLAHVKASAVPHARAEFIAFAEDHSFPEPDWAENLVAGHEKGYAGVAPEMRNANPDSVVSWVAMFLHFGGTVLIGDEGFEADYPGASHNMSYRKDALLALGDDLGDRMLAELFLHEALRARGGRLRVEPAAVTRHVNVGYLRPLLWHSWVGGRLYGELRYRFGTWPLWRRIVYAGGSPLIPLLRVRRALREMRRAGRMDLVPRILPPMIAALLVNAAGEATGYLFGMGKAKPQYSDLETRRFRFVPPGDRTLWA